MRIAITIDNVLRKTLSKLIETYSKYNVGDGLIKNEFDTLDEERRNLKLITDIKKLPELFPVRETRYDLTDERYRNMDNGLNDYLDNKGETDLSLLASDKNDIKDIYDFMYNHASFEIFGASEYIGDSNIINDFIYEFEGYEGNEITFVSKEYHKSQNATLFFLSKTNLDVKNVSLVRTYENIWDKYDLIITSDPELITTKPDNKYCVKIKSPYNEMYQCDITFETINEALYGDTLINKIK